MKKLKLRKFSMKEKKFLYYYFMLVLLMGFLIYAVSTFWIGFHEVDLAYISQSLDFEYLNHTLLNGTSLSVDDLYSIGWIRIIGMISILALFSVIFIIGLFLGEAMGV